MAAPSKSLLKYNDPVLVNKSINKSLKVGLTVSFSFTQKPAKIGLNDHPQVSRIKVF